MSFDVIPLLFTKYLLDTHDSTVYSSREMETTQIPTDWGIAKKYNLPIIFHIISWSP